MIIFWIILFFLLISLVMFWFILRAFKNPVRLHDRTPADLEIPFNEINIPTKNNCSLYGWWIPGAETSPAIILVHGWGRNAGRMMPYIKKLHEKGFNLIAFDSRNHGTSDTDNYSTMLKFAEDIKCAINYASDNGLLTEKNVGVVGLSIGGAAAIYASAHDERIKAVVTVGAFAHPMEVMKKQLKDHYIPFPYIWLAMKYIQNKVGFKFSDIAPVNHIYNSDAEFLLIHGEKDITIPIEQAEKLINKGKKGNVQLWKLPNKGHSNCHHEESFWNKVNDFLYSKLS